jgi:hypothetical protein
MKKSPQVTDTIGTIFSRRQLAGGWIDRAFVSRLNLPPPGLLAVALEPDFRVMDRSGCAGGCLLATSRKAVTGTFRVTDQMAP